MVSSVDGRAMDDHDINQLALSATLHCLTGCAIGEVVGVIIGTALGWSNGATIALAIVLAFVFGYSLTSWPLRSRAGTDLGIIEAETAEQAVKAALSSAVVELGSEERTAAADDTLD